VSGSKAREKRLWGEAEHRETEIREVAHVKVPGVLKGLGVTLRELFEPKVTHFYPDEPYEFPNRLRGSHVLYVDKCIVCNQCANVCPTGAITLGGKPNPDPTKKGKVLDFYEINYEICIFCDLCTEVCPTDAITMAATVEHAAYRRDDLHKDIVWLAENPHNLAHVRKETSRR